MIVYSFTACSGNRDFDENVDARRAALDAGSFAHASPDRSGGMFSLPVLFARSSLDMCHQSLELAFLKLSRVFARNEACADRKPAVHRSRAAMKSAVPMAACFNRTNCKHFSSIHGCLYGFSRIIFVGMNLLHVETTKLAKSRAASSAVVFSKKDCQVVSRKTFRSFAH